MSYSEWRLYLKVTSGDSHVYLYRYSAFLDSQSLYFLENDSKLLKEKAFEMIPEYGMHKS